MSKSWSWVITIVLFFCTGYAFAQNMKLEGTPSDVGYNVGSMAAFHATLTGAKSDPARYVVFADIQYLGTTSVTSVQLDRKAARAGALEYEGTWPIPENAPTGIYGVTLRAEDRAEHREVARQKIRSFGTYRKALRISSVRLDKTYYTVGEPIECEVTIENLTDRDLKDLRVEFSNANYPWISTFSGEKNLSGQQAVNPELALRVLRDHLDIPAHGHVTIPMMPAGTATFLQGTLVALLGAGGPARHEKVPPPEVDNYTLAVWDSARTVLYDMQFSPQAVIRPPDRDLPKPYSNQSFTHRYNSDIDYTKYREFYPPGMISAALVLDHSRTLYRPGDKLQVVANVRDLEQVPWSNAELHAVIHNRSGKQTENIVLAREINLQPGESKKVSSDSWTIPATFSPGTYTVEFSLTTGDRVLARAGSEIAVNQLPSSLLVFAPHEDDEHSYAGLIRAAVEAGIPTRVVVFTGGDVGECERYLASSCDPNDAREFGMVRMEETAEALEHIGLTRDKLSILGLPDGGSGEIWFHHIKPSDPFLSVYLAADHAPYDNVLQPNLPFARDAVIDLVKQIITEFHPAMIATPHPDERHVDHRTTNWFVLKACQELLKEKKIDPNTVILADQAYGAGGYKPAPYKYETFPVYLSGEASALKQEMSWIYQSQDGNIAEGMKKTWTELPRQEIHYRILDWQEHEGWNE